MVSAVGKLKYNTLHGNLNYIIFHGIVFWLSIPKIFYANTRNLKSKVDDVILLPRYTFSSSRRSGKEVVPYV